MFNKYSVFNAAVASAIMILSFSGCGHSESGGAPEPVDVFNDDAPLVTRIDALAQNEDAEECDRWNAEKAHELGVALEERSEAIQAYVRSLPPSEGFRRVPLGPTFVRELPAPRPAQVGWQFFIKGWDQLYRRYLSIKDQPVGPAWNYLNNAVRGILVDDAARIAGGYNSELDKDSGSMISELKSLVTACIGRSDCAELSLSPLLEDRVWGNSFYRYFVGHLQRESDTAKKRDLLTRFLRRLNVDEKRYAFFPNASILRSGNDFILPLDPGPFAGSEEALRGLIESLWANETYHLRIRWASVAAQPGIFRIDLGEVPGARPFVNRESKTLQLFPDFKSRGLAHEVGHVLGFKDRYYTAWQPAHCVYVEQYNEQDLMSDSTLGFVTPEEWAELDQHYPDPHPVPAATPVEAPGGTIITAVP